MSPVAAWQFWLICVSLLPSLFVSIAGSAAVAVFYAFGEARLPTLIGLLGFVLSLVLKSVLFYRFGVIGISIGASCYLMLNMTLYHLAVVWRLTKKSA
jgi:peptidoglycan biosynthesis protein MviN/MurJ (putative lipid II flippase)